MWCCCCWCVGDEDDEDDNVDDDVTVNVTEDVIDIDNDGDDADGDDGAAIAPVAAPVAMDGKQADSKCLFRYDLRANDLKHRGHAKFLSPEWVCMCARRLDRSANALPQCAQP